MENEVFMATTILILVDYGLEFSFFQSKSVAVVLNFLIPPPDNYQITEWKKNRPTFGTVMSNELYFYYHEFIVCGIEMTLKSTKKLFFR